MKKILFLFLVCALLLSSCGNQEQSAPEVAVGLDKNDPVMIEIWTYYNSRAQEVLDNYIKRFNETAGLEKGIIVTQIAFGSIDALTEALLASSKNVGGSSSVPDLFITYKGIVATLPNKTQLLDFKEYLSEGEWSAYVDAFVKTGSLIESPEKHSMFSIDKASEVLMINETAVDELVEQGIMDYSDLGTYEGLRRAAARYYDYTDSLTPENYDGKALFGANSLVNLVWLSAAELGADITSYDRGERIRVDKAVFRRIYDAVILPYIQGHYDNSAKYVTEDIRSGNVLIGQSSTSSTPFFPPEVLQSNGEMKKINGRVLPLPIFEGSERLLLIQGGGVFGFKRTEKAALASVIFLKWLTSEENALDFALTKSYLPALRSVFNKEKIEETYRDKKIDKLTADVFMLLIDLFSGCEIYEPSPTAHYEVFRFALGKFLNDSWHEGREEYRVMLESKSPEEAIEYFKSDAYFELWYSKIVSLMNETLKK